MVGGATGGANLKGDGLNEGAALVEALSESSWLHSEFGGHGRDSDDPPIQKDTYESGPHGPVGVTRRLQVSMVANLRYDSPH